MTGFSIFMLIFGICLLITGLYMYCGNKIKMLEIKPAYKNLSKDNWKKIGKWTIVISIIVFIISLLAAILKI